MLVIFANRLDPGARALAARWTAHSATLLTSADLSVAGWRHSLDPCSASTAVLGGRLIAAGDITAVLTRWPCVFEPELAHIVPEDRAYVAAEMTAFLRSWLTRLPCPVVNRPTAANLTGPSWRPEQWVHVAAGLGIPVRPVRRLARLSVEPPPKSPEPPPGTVTVVGECSFGEVDPSLKAQARRLASAADVDLLAVHFSGTERGAELLSADPLPDLGDGEVADTLLDLLVSARSTCCAAGGRP